MNKISAKHNPILDLFDMALLSFEDIVYLLYALKGGEDICNFPQFFKSTGKLFSLPTKEEFALEIKRVKKRRISQLIRIYKNIIERA